MELIGRLRAGTARAATRLGREPRAHRRWLQGVRVLLYVSATVILGWLLYNTQVEDSPPLLVVVQVLSILLLYGAGRWPVVMAGLSLPLVVAELALGVPFNSLAMVVPFIIAGVLVATRPRQVGYLYVLAMILILTTMQPTGFLLGDLASWMLLFLVPCFIGEVVRFMRRSVERIRRTSVEQLARQRRHLARELHDTSIHDITAMIMALERAKLTGVDEPKAVEEIDHAIAVGRQSVVSMRGVLKILRSEDVDTAAKTPDSVPVAIAAATPTVHRALDEARASLTRAGHHDVRIHVEDQIDLPMPFSVRTALVRVIQECTANMAKYARPGGPCTIMIERTETETRALFINDARPRSEDDAALSSGVGLIGVRERVEAVGGSLAVRHHGGRWIIQASIPTISSVSEGQVERAAQH